LRKLSEEELENIVRELRILKTQAQQVAEAMGIKYSEALLLLVLRECVIANARLQATQQIHVKGQGDARGG
jgi:antitoxin component of RelBE/YafQ-DinJ toxin-antitoxin module